jgi:hypothetical protein
MFILADERLTWIDVSVPRLDEAGALTHQTLRVKVHLVDYDRFLEIVDATQKDERAIVHEIARDWEGVQARKADGTIEPFPFSPANLDKAMQQPMFIGGFFSSYFKAWRGQKEEREGNSEGSPGAGQSATPEPTSARPLATPTSSG